MANWLCVRTTGSFRYGRTYNDKQLGVLGRMAVKGGFLVRADDIPERLVTNTRRRGGRRKKGAIDGVEGGVQAGGGPDVRDDAGA